MSSMLVGLRADMIALPAVMELADLRHRCVLRRRQAPAVQRPCGSRMPQHTSVVQEQAQLLNVYFRPWCLRHADASPHVPLIQHLDVCFPTPGQERRRRYKKEGQPRSHAAAWASYVRGHVVSEHAVRTIRNCLQTMHGVVSKADENDGSGHEEQARAADVDTSWVTGEIIDRVIQPLAEGEVDENVSKRVRLATQTTACAEASWVRQRRVFLRQAVQNFT